MIAKRIIPCLDVKNGRVVKGVNFSNLKDIEDPVTLAEFYNASGADELVFYDIAASVEGRPLFSDVLRRTAARVFIPLTVGGSINSTADFERVLGAGADKVSVNTGAVKNPELIRDAAKRYGNQCVVLSMDVAKTPNGWHIFLGAGKTDTGIDALEWAVRGEAEGAGELVVNSVDTDGVRKGFDLALLKAVADRVGIPVIASGGAGKKEDFGELFKIDGIDAGLAAGIFHSRELEIRDLKNWLSAQGVPVRNIREGI